MRFVILLVVGIISFAPSRVGPSLSFPSVDRPIAFGPFENPAVSTTLRCADPSQPLDVRRDDAIEAFFELEEDEDLGFHETLVSHASGRPLGSTHFHALSMTMKRIPSNRPIHSGRSSLLRC